MIPIKGLQKTSLIDFEPYTACVVFLGGCNFRCGYCHNPELVLNFKELPVISEAEFFSFLDSRKKWLDGVCITGGEPCLYDGLVEFISKIKEKGFKVKLDTNGSRPGILKELIEKKLIDYIAMDVKTKPENYNEVCGVRVNLEKIKKSISLIKESDINYEFRTTVIPGFITKEDIVEVGKLLKGSKKYIIQNFNPKNDMIENRFKNVQPYKKEKLEEMKESVKNSFKEILVRS